MELENAITTAKIKKHVDMIVMQMSNKSQKVDLKQFSYTPKAFLPGLPRLEHVQHPRSPLPEDIYSSNVCQTFQLEPEVRKTNDFFAMKQSDEKSNPTMSSYENLEESSMSNLTDTDKSVSLFSETLNVNFELGNEIWNDYNDGSFVCNNTNMQELKDPESSPLESKNIYSPNKTKPDVCLHNSYSPSLTPPSSNKLFLEYGNQNIFRLQEYNLPEKLKMAQLTTTSETTLRSYQVAGKEDFLLLTKP
ncbi:hypothetical protein E2320_010474 [Naja naja]|nr:hypothetical protein E2320_010474 [Naja naja]